MTKQIQKILEVRLPLRQYQDWITRRYNALSRGIILQHEFKDYPVPTHLQIHQSILLYGLQSDDIKSWILSDTRLKKKQNRNILVYMRMCRDSTINYITY